MMRACPSASCHGSAITDFAGALDSSPDAVLLAKAEVREALRVWYPAQSRRRQLHELRKVTAQAKRVHQPRTFAIGGDGARARDARVILRE